MKSIFVKIFALSLTVTLFLLTFADSYIKTVGKIDDAYDITDLSHKLDAVNNTLPSDSLRVMTYNLLADCMGFDGTKAQTRAYGTCEILKKITPAVAGVQEMSRNWFASIINNTQYKCILPIRTGITGTMTALLYNPKLVRPLMSGEKIFDEGDDSRLRRMVWGVFIENSSKKIFAVINSHFSLNNNPNAVNNINLSQALELIEQCKTLNKIYRCPVIALGDFNTAPSRPTYQLLTTTLINTQDIALKNNYSDSPVKNNDYIFVYGNIKADALTYLSIPEAKPLSDHYPVVADFMLE